MGFYDSVMAPAAGYWANWMLLMSIQVAVLAGIIWAIARLAPKSSASLRHALWLLVFIKLVLPPSLSAPWSAASLIDRVAPIEILRDGATGLLMDGAGGETPNTTDSKESQFGATAPQLLPSILPSTPVTVMVVWLCGALIMSATIAVQAWRYRSRVLSNLNPAPAELHNLARGIADRLELSRDFRICVSGQLKIPAVMGVWRPTIVLPELLVGGLSHNELCDVIGHELAHIKRNDIPLGWLTALLLSLYWFHPAVWLAQFNLRREREMASDDTVLYTTRQEGRHYASTIIRMAENFDETAPAGAGFLGILEIADNLLHRVRSAADAARPRRMGRVSAVAVALLAVLLLPMTVWTPTTLAADVPPAEAAAPPPSPVDTPAITSSQPANGASDVDPALSAIRVTFNVDMAQGFSWTGGPPLFPETTGKPRWVDARTCELPVKLESGKVYRLGINSKSHRNFRSVAGAPVRPQVIAFVTKGGDPSLAGALKPPNVVSMNPERGASGVSPALDKLVVTFDRAMGGGFSWTGGGENYPETAGAPSWSDDKKTCTLPVKLKPDWKYRVGLNSPSHVNFQSSYGIPLQPVEWTFSTGK
ncbi:MAG: Ig-like domain-containing protein [Candidatus Hydrogenedentes bacterium]|nr:Ig-like domain-containing protein [Candidatus Hydrogenedentota bacterium]